MQANKAVQNTVEQNKVGGEVFTGEDILRRCGRLYYDRGETILRSRGDFLMGETISRDTGFDDAAIVSLAEEGGSLAMMFLHSLRGG